MTLTEFNLSIGQNLTGPVGLMQAVNTNLMYDMYGVFVLLSLGIILFMTFQKRYENFGKSMAGTFFIVFLTGLFLRIMGLIVDRTLFITLILMVLAAIILRPREF